MKWLMNMPVSPKKDVKGDYSKDWIAWVKGRHPGEDIDHHIHEWTLFLEGKIIGEPMGQARSAEEYKRLGWVGIYEGIARVAKTERILKVRSKLG